MKALFKRSAPSLPPALPPATPFPSLEYRRDIQSSGTISSGGSRHRAFSLSRDYNAGSSPNMVISQPMLQTELRSPPPEHFVYGRKRLQSGGITFDEVLPSLSASPGSAPPVPQLPTASLSLSTPTSCGSPNRVRTPLSIPIPPAALSALEQAYETCTSNPEDVSPSSVLALENTVTTPTRTPRPSVRRRRVSLCFLKSPIEKSDLRLSRVCLRELMKSVSQHLTSVDWYLLRPDHTGIS